MIASPTIDSPLGNIDYDERGDGPTLVLVPGSCSTGAAWRPVIAQWQDRYRCVTTSLLGYGRTAERRTGATADMAYEAEMLEAVIRRAMALRAGPDVFLRQSEAVITRADRTAVFKTLRVPTLFLWGRHDQFAPPERAQAYAAGVPGARVVVVEDCGHLPTLEQPDATTGAIREWLARL